MLNLTRCSHNKNKNYFLQELVRHTGYILEPLKHDLPLEALQSKSNREKYGHHYYDDQTIQNLARYFKIDQHPEMLFLLRKIRKDGY